jgi:integrase
MRGLKAGSQANRDRRHYVTTDDIEKVNAACPDHEWKLFFALARYAGLRTPSETSRLTSNDILWEDPPKMVVSSPKTEHHGGLAQRAVPILPELLPDLRDAYDLAPKAPRTSSRCTAGRTCAPRRTRS